MNLGYPSLVSVLLFLSGCQRSVDPQTHLAALEQTLSAGISSNSVPSEAGVYVNAALEAIRQNDYAGGVMALQSVQQMPQMTAEQLKSVHAAMQTLTTTLVDRAARGDAKAQADLAAIERTRSQ